MKKLLQAGAEAPTETQRAGGPSAHSWLDAVDEDIGCTAFHYAAVMGHRECTAALQRAGCSTEIQSRDGVGPCSLSLSLSLSLSVCVCVCV